ncbi:MAG TPA: mechanosensitive ion channel family protein [Gemmatimonadota bacterium]|nr:mechanosensitive ion channel family protein [Gemmatimonadota bacterium]
MPAAADNLASTIVQAISTWGLQVLGAVVVLLVGWVVSRWVRTGVRRALERARTDPVLVGFLSGAAHYGVLLFVGLAVLNLFGIQTTSLVAVLGAAGFAVGLALQGTLANFSAGVMLLVFRPFSVGDFVETGGASGTVRELGLFTTRMDTPDNVRILVPNSAIFGSVIRNFTGNETRRVDLEVGIDYGDDVAAAIAACEALLEAEARVLADPAPVVAVAALGDSSVNLMVRPWCRTEDYWPLRRDLTRGLKEALEAAGCSLPFPQRDVHLFRADAAGEGA